ncbi:AraC family transcriptional regulator [Sinorhizobium sp. A49]|uniref:helix-turn-helix domain-containing protein n=1 Tax=Sinorhizobium sp. A49 TaxID=1945861 RepID=UPI000984E81B|nr:AraC family transcriptional regulator [Sinorhizobium sp. A49]OOG76612.1 AraC family transcriptional regulator [Sinorhizobium sp. A49]
MLFVPLPFVVSLLLTIVIVRMLSQRDDVMTFEQRLFLLLVCAYALQSVLIGIRWGYDIRAILPAQAMLATFNAALAWVCFSNLASDSQPSLRQIGWHLLPALIVGVMMFAWRDAVGTAIILFFLGYGIALLWLARLGPNALVTSRLDGVLRSYRALQITGWALVASALSDVAIGFDQTRNGGAYSGAIVAAGNVLALLILGTAASIASFDTSTDNERQDEEPLPEERAASEEDAQIVQRIGELMHKKALYKDLELNLSRIARKLGVPARRISNAINRMHGISVSQYVNNYRVEEACRLLQTTNEAITQIAFEAGFLTKSNFNREFLRVTGKSPSSWREEQRVSELRRAA